MIRGHARRKREGNQELLPYFRFDETAVAEQLSGPNVVFAYFSGRNGQDFPVFPLKTTTSPKDGALRFGNGYLLAIS